MQDITRVIELVSELDKLRPELRPRYNENEKWAGVMSIDVNVQKDGDGVAARIHISPLTEYFDKERITITRTGDGENPYRGSVIIDGVECFQLFREDEKAEFDAL